MLCLLGEWAFNPANKEILKSLMFLLQIWFWFRTTSVESPNFYWYIYILTWGLTWKSVNPLPSLPLCSIQRKSLDLNLPPATAPSRGKTLPTPVQLEFTNSRIMTVTLSKPCVNMHHKWSYSFQITLNYMIIKV